MPQKCQHLNLKDFDIILCRVIYVGISNLVSITLNIVVILFRQNVYGTICGVIWLVKDKNNNGRK